jgi:hypothetical protein
VANVRRVAIKKRFSQMGRGDKLFFEITRHTFAGDIGKEFALMKEMFDIDPMPWVINFQMGYTASKYNRPGVTVEVFRHLDPVTIEFDIPAKKWWFSEYANALIRLERLEEAKRILSMVPEDKVPDYYY